MGVGIDKLKFSSPGYRVKDWHSSGLTMRPSDIVAGKEQASEPFCIKDSQGHKVHGTKAFLNDELFNLTIDPTSARLEFNPSKPYHAFELCSDEKTLKGRIDNVLLTLDQNYGIQLDLAEAKVRRIDLAKNVALNNPVSLYSDVFSMLRCKRQKRSGSFNQETFNFGTSGTRFFQFYNKGLELEEDNYPPEITLPLGSKFMRGEIQLQKTGIHSALGMKTFDHFMQTGFDFYQDKYSDLMHKELFKYQSLDSDEFQMSIQYEHDFLIEELKKFRARHKYGYERFVFAYGSQNVLQMFGGSKAFREAVFIASGGNRGTADRVLKKVQSAIFSCHLPDNKQLVKMYSELRTKFAS